MLYVGTPGGSGFRYAGDTGESAQQTTNNPPTEDFLPRARAILKSRNR